jgi:hypothetical protein
MTALSPGRFGPLPDDALLTRGLWQYAHYYGPVTARRVCRRDAWWLPAALSEAASSFACRRARARVRDVTAW